MYFNSEYATRKKINSMASKIFVVDSTILSHLANHVPTFYNYGEYGWNWTACVWECGIAFIDGYRSFPKGCIYNDERIKELEKVFNETSFSYDSESFEKNAGTRKKALENFYNDVMNN